MGFYILSDGKGSYIHRDDSAGKYVQIRDYKKATQFDSITKANSILNNSVPKSYRGNYAVQFLETEKAVEKDEDKAREICFKPIDDGNIDEWETKVKGIIDVFSNLDGRENKLNIELSNVDKQIVDIEHYIEFGKFNCYQGWLCFKMLQNLLQQRRKYKNELEVLAMMRQCTIQQDSLKKLANNISEITNKCYRPRAFPELFRSGK